MTNEKQVCATEQLNVFTSTWDILWIVRRNLMRRNAVTGIILELGEIILKKRDQEGHQDIEYRMLWGSHDGSVSWVTHHEDVDCIADVSKICHQLKRCTKETIYSEVHEERKSTLALLSCHVKYSVTEVIVILLLTRL
jgi:hypothetical protein